MDSQNKDDKDIHEEEPIEDDLDTVKKPSYTYWKRESDQPFSKDFIPQKNDQIIQPVIENSDNKNFGSAWNTAGTWEEKHLLKNIIEDFFNNSIQKSKKIFKDSFTIVSMSEYLGDVSYYLFFNYL